MFRLGDRSIWFDEAVSWRFLQFPIGEMLQRLSGENYPPVYVLILRLWRDLFGESLVALRGLSVLLAGVATVASYLFAAAAFGPWQRRTDRQLESSAVRGVLRPSVSLPHTVTIFEAAQKPIPTGRSDEGVFAIKPQTAVADVVRRATWIGLASSAFFAVSVLQIRLAWEMRMYSLGAALVMLSSWTHVRALRAVPQRGGPWLLYALITLLFAYTHYFALFSIAAQLLFAVGYLVAMRRRRGHLDSRAEGAASHPAISPPPRAEHGEYLAHRGLAARTEEAPADGPPVATTGVRLRFAAMGYAVLAVGWAPWLPVFLKQAQQVREKWWSTSLVDFWEVPLVLYKLLFPLENGGFTWTGALVVTAVCAAVLVGVLIKGRAGDWYTVCLVVVPLSLGVLVSVVGRNLLVDRYLAFMQPFLLVAFAALMAKVSSHAVRNIAAGLVLVNAMAIYSDYMQSLDIPSHPGAREAAKYIEGERQPDELVIVSSPLLYLPLLYYARERTSWHVYNDGKPFLHFVGAQVLTREEIMPADRLVAIRGGRVWLVTTSGGWGREMGMPVPSRWIKEGQEERFADLFQMPLDYVVQAYRAPK